MSGPFAKSLVSFVMPGGLLVASVGVVLSTTSIPRSLEPLLNVAPAAVFAASILLGWFFNRSRVVFGVLVLAMACYGVLFFPTAGSGPGTGRMVFHAVSLLLPINFLALAVITERGILTRWGMVRLLVIIFQLFIIELICRPGQEPVAPLLDHAFVNPHWTGWTRIPQPALVAFIAAFIWHAVRFAVDRDAIESGCLWALAAAFLGLNEYAEQALACYFAAAGLVLALAVLQTSYVMAYHDELTGLPGRRALNEALLKLSGQYTVAMVDIDHFKTFNDQYGHDVGDQVLRMVASHLADVSGGGRPFRYGGEEFAVVFVGKSLDEVLPHLEALRKTIEGARFTLRSLGRPHRKPTTPNPSSGARKSVCVTISIGAAECNDPYANPDEVVRAADRALYRAKKAGRNRVRIEKA